MKKKILDEKNKNIKKIESLKSHKKRKTYKRNRRDSETGHEKRILELPRSRLAAKNKNE